MKIKQKGEGLLPHPFCLKRGNLEEECMKKDVTVVILDSGVDRTHPIFNNSNCNFVSLTAQEDLIDLIGHGTAVCSIISRYGAVQKAYVGKILEEEVDISALVRQLWFIHDNISCDIINLSLGVLFDYSELKEVCDALDKKGIIIVSAFDNGGAISYPAAYSSVIGVDSSPRCVKSNDFVYVENSPINLKAKGGIQRVPWINNTYILAQGASFAAPYITAKISTLLAQGIPKSQIMKLIREESRFVYNFESIEPFPQYAGINKFTRTAIFPFNKEIHSLVRFSDQLSFQIYGVYDSKYSGHIGKEISIQGRDEVVQNINSLNFAEIDSLIIGHINEMEILIGKEIKSELLQKCLDYNVNVYCFDSINTGSFKKRFEERDLILEYPDITNHMLPKNKFDKLYQAKTPILTIMGTSKQQGKFTLQLELRKRLKQIGYNVAQMGTEPSSPLFGLELTFPFGYGSNIPFSGESTLDMSNYLIHQLDILNADIILTGSQSGTVPMMFDNLGQMTTEQVCFLIGINPDAVVLCVNYNEDLEYVNRTIKAIEGLANTSVIAISLFPAYTPNGWFQASNTKILAEPKALNGYKKILYEHFKIPVFILGDDADMEQIVNYCIDFFSEI